MNAAVRWRSAGSSLHPGQPSGDVSLVQTFDDGVLVAVADGLGHGAPAAHAATLAVEILATSPAAPLERLMLACHEGLKRTRGVALTLAQLRVSASSLCWTAVGNVDALLLRPTQPPQRILARGGVLGHVLPSLRTETVALSRGDYLVLATDGLRSELAYRLKWSETSLTAVPEILERFSKGSDDAHLLVVEYLGAALV